MDIGTKQPDQETKDHDGDLEFSQRFTEDPVLIRAILRKIDLHLMVPLWIIFAFGFLDRINLGNVAVLGIVPELKLGKNGLNIALQVFFVPYILFDIPSNILLKKFRPSTWISILTFSWGIMCMCQGFVKSKGGLIACRFLLGVFEAGFVPGCAYLMSMYYRRYDFQKRFSLFWVAGLIAGAFGGLLAYALYHMNGLSGYSGWRWIFIIEGLLAIAVALPAKFLIADWPDEAKFLTIEEKEYLQQIQSNDISTGETGVAQMNRLDAAAWKRILTDWKVYVGGLVYLGITVSGYATALFIPSIVASLGYSGIEAQVHSIPVWIVAAVVTFGVSIATDRLKHRYGFIMFGVVFASIGYIVLLCEEPVNTHVRYMAVFFVTVGCYIVQPVAVVWLANNFSGHYKRAVGLAIQIGFGNIGGIIASNIFVSNEAPRYFVGYGVSLAMMIFCGIMSSVYAFGLTVENKRRAEGKLDDRLQLSNIGDDDPRFRFTL
ncbi:major facilitator superfamily domain-containing protein [Talaromyces proteolyticus]|uniref:Major facilitator superfamily domain-containing protein n=1 Tax=Talaromyces proteolyticus TaxID=1131652 RepID=A0AAD4PUC1_9EURO|nr:major facilitator superfamily domain-containing protein [Talaromyces proteolyticus]KAH8689165.1 major facilitator superfamily domain-containing protein [Talaromyces proteolyticus]